MTNFLKLVSEKLNVIENNGLNAEIEQKNSKKISLFKRTNETSNDSTKSTSKNAFEDATFLSKSTVKSLKNGVKYATSKIPKSLAPAYAVYTSNGKYKISDKRVSDFTDTNKNGSKGWDLDALIDAAGSLTTVEKANLNINLEEYADFMSKEKYKDYASAKDVAPLDEKENIKNCLDICDYMNFGYSITPKSEIFEENSNWEEKEYVNNSETGFYGEVFINDKNKEIIIGYCGTNDMDDAVTDDLSMMLKEVPDQYEDALNLYQKYANDPKFNDYKISLTGHSLGASLAQLVGATEEVANSKTPPTVATFNAFGTYDIIENNKEEYNFANQENLNDAKIYNYITEGDLVSCTTKHVGQTTWVKNQSPVAHMTTSLHLELESDEYNVNKAKLNMAKETVSKIFNFFKK